MKIYVTSVFVDDQSKAEQFYVRKLGFKVKHDIPLGTYRWLTLVSGEEPNGTELLLEPSDHPAVGPYKAALVEDGIPAASFQVGSVNEEYDRLEKLGVTFTMKPTDAGNVRTAIFDDTCGNLVQLVEMKG